MPFLSHSSPINCSKWDAGGGLSAVEVLAVAVTFLINEDIPRLFVDIWGPREREMRAKLTCARIWIQEDDYLLD